MANEKELRGLIREEIKRIISEFKSPKKPLTEGVWNRRPGQGGKSGLPTLAETSAAYKAKKLKEEADHNKENTMFSNKDAWKQGKPDQDLWKEESDDAEWAARGTDTNTLDTAKGGTDNSMNKAHQALIKLGKEMEKLLADYKAQRISKDVYVAKRKPLQAKRNKLEAAIAGEDDAV